MALTPGSRVGSYDIVSPIGAGGMGEVYRATDARLGREVAIKVLPAAFAEDQARLVRFEREARTLAALNHPNIAHLYGLEESGAVKAIVMELVEGETLAERLASGQGSGIRDQGSGVPVDEALAIAKQIADALEAAHEHGIVHRDLKPANIKVRPDGTVKVLDFGLAKAIETVGGGPSAVGSESMSPTITTPAMTQAGMILGTAAYMSPEQAKGREADQGSDIWSFGCVLYEMIAGRRAFEAEDVAETLALVLTKTPDWSALPATTPPVVRRLLERCLERDRRRRVAKASTVRFVLEEAASLAPSAAGPIAPDPVEARQSVEALVARTRRDVMRRAVWPVAASGLVLAVAAAGAAWVLRSPGSPQVVRFAVPYPASPGASPAGTGQSTIAISPDGTRVVYVANQRLYLRTLSDLEAKPIEGTVGDPVAPAFSPDGLSIAYYARDERIIRRVSVSGGTPVRVCGTGGGVNGLGWRASHVIFSSVRGVWQCRSDGSDAQQLIALEREEAASWPQILPDGERVLFQLGQRDGGNLLTDDTPIVVQSLRTGARTTVVPRGAHPQYLPSGHLLYAVGGTIFAVAFDPDNARTAGAAVPVLEGVRRGAAVAEIKVSDNGSLVYLPGPASTTYGRSELAIADREGRTMVLSGPPGVYSHPRVSRDGSRLALGVVEGQEENVWVRELRGETAMRRLTFGGRSRFPVLSPDGQRVAYQSDRDGDTAVYAQRFDGTGAAERLTKPEAGVSHAPEAWSPDGRHLLVAASNDSRYTLWVLSLEEEKIVPFGRVESADPPQAVFSPDGRWVAYASNPMAGGVPQPDRGVYLQPFPATDAQYKLPAVFNDFHPAWSPDGLTLFYVPSVRRFVSVGVTTAPGVAFGSPAALVAVLRNPTSANRRDYDVLPDGRFIGLVAEGSEDASVIPGEIRVVLNWMDELKRLVPAK